MSRPAPTETTSGDLTPSDIVFLTDFGLEDWFVAVMKGVARGLAPGAALLDLTHEIEPGQADQASFVLGQAAPWFRPGTVFCVVVDPGVGTARRALVGADGERLYVAPDNGVLSEVVRAAGPAWQSRAIENPDWVLPDASHTFHGRDVFAPVAARLAAGASFHEAGPLVQDYVRLPNSLPRKTGARAWRGSVLYVDRFGNAITSFRVDVPPFGKDGPPPDAPVTLRMVDLELDAICATYADAFADEPLAYWGSGGHLEIAVNGGDAAETFGIRVGDPVLLSFDNLWEAGGDDVVDGDGPENT